jgi:hypothetical protein
MQSYSLEPTLHALIPEVLPHALGDFRSRTVIAEEGQSQIPEELRPIFEHAGADSVENLDGQAASTSAGKASARSEPILRVNCRKCVNTARSLLAHATQGCS